jgi:spore coat polysaccharide biosynthesis protein SpsF
MNYCFIQARCASLRLPGKVLLPICGKPVLRQIIERVRFAKLIDKIIVVTSMNPENDAIVELCNQLKTDSFRGSEDDVLDRYKTAIKVFGINYCDNIIRVTADCPLICPDLIDIMLKIHKDNDLTTNCIKRTYPDGLDVEVFKAGLLNRPDFHKINFFEKEYTDMDFEGFKITNIIQEEDLSSLRWTLDTQRDYEFINKVYEALYKPGQIFLMEDVLRWLSRQG